MIVKKIVQSKLVLHPDPESNFFESTLMPLYGVKRRQNTESIVLLIVNHYLWFGNDNGICYFYCVVNKQSMKKVFKVKEVIKILEGLGWYIDR